MEIMLLLAIGILIAFWLPNSIILILLIPISVVLSSSNILPLHSSMENHGIRLSDILILIVGIKCLLSNKFSLKSMIFNTGGRHFEENKLVKLLYTSIWAFLSVLVLTTIIAFFRLGNDVFVSELISFLRFFSQISVFFLLVYCIKGEKRIHSSHYLLQLVGYLILLSAYITYILYTFWGISFGELQTSEIGEARFFGLIGDQIGFIANLFYFKEILSGRIILALIAGSVTLLSVTRGAIISLLFGTIILIYLKKRTSLKLTKIKTKRSSLFKLFIILFTGLILFVVFGGILSQVFNEIVGGTLNRSLNPNFSDSSILQRQLTIGIAWKVFLDNFFTGVGYTGFRFVSLDYPEIKFFPSYIPVENALATTNNQFLQVATDAGIFGLLVFGVLMFLSLKLLHVASIHAPQAIKNDFKACQIWLLTLLVANHSACWMLPYSLISFLYWIVLALAVTTLNNRSDENLSL